MSTHIHIHTAPARDRRKAKDATDPNMEKARGLHAQWNRLMNQRTVEQDPAKKAALMKQIVALESQLSKLPQPDEGW